MSNTCVLATNNKAKVLELNAFFEKEGLKVVSLADLGLFLQPPEETGTTFEENATIKATETARFLAENGHENMLVLADDSGLCVDAMNGEPGVDSALFLGESTPYSVRNAEIIKNVENAETRAARFMCVIVCVMPSGKILVSTGTVEGEIAREPSGAGGFGYDPIFYVPQFNKTMAQLSMEEKNKISHRGQAVTKMLEIINENIGCK
jgi:XTP/dITP diphosphohydrolase